MLGHPKMNSSSDSNRVMTDEHQDLEVQSPEAALGESASSKLLGKRKFNQTKQTHQGLFKIPLKGPNRVIMAKRDKKANKATHNDMNDYVEDRSTEAQGYFRRYQRNSKTGRPNQVLVCLHCNAEKPKLAKMMRHLNVHRRDGLLRVDHEEAHETNTAVGQHIRLPSIKAVLRKPDCESKISTLHNAPKVEMQALPGSDLEESSSEQPPQLDEHYNLIWLNRTAPNASRLIKTNQEDA